MTATGTDSNVQPIPTDANLAAEIRAELRPLLEQVAAVLNKGRKQGLVSNFNIGIDAYGRHAVNSIDVVRPL